MILAIDSYYFENKAKTVCLIFEQWNSLEINSCHSEIVSNIENYVPGEFYKRELPCIISLISKLDLTKIDFIIIDGFVYLDDNDKFGLGAYLFEKLSSKIPIIGVAKTDFISLNKNKQLLLRGKSKKPLFITSIGININEATDKIKIMNGEYRIPTLLKELDKLTKEK
ncbi:endonuclease V [Flavobacterium sp.]|uniref:endonuclease V n=1 Tax=Flavobacterium sp. TaxID=239 RepID=UPI002C4F6390|nr:endonuclease V [Flavobacterium sp.]HSD06362.1 endonuclease V [Flavobacterium sp.]